MTTQGSGPPSWRRRLASGPMTGLALAGMLGAAMVWTPVAHAQGQAMVGRYTLRSVNGQALPADVPSLDAHHKTRVTGGVLVLNPDSTFICETRAQTSYLGLAEQRADTASGTYDTIGGSFVALQMSRVEIDTVATTGQRITWTHVTHLSSGTNVYLYSR